MKKIASIIGFSTALIASGGISFLSSCSKTNDENHKLTPQVRQIRAMDENVPNITVGDFRLQILDDSTVRFEYKYQNPIYGTYGWLDDDTFFVPNRTLYPGPSSYSVRNEGAEVVVKFSDITIRIPNTIGSSMEGIKVYQDGITEPIYVTKPLAEQTKYNTGELPKPEDTGNVFEFVDFPRIIEPVLGYSEDNKLIEPYRSYWNNGLKENCGYEIQQQKDIYLTFPHKNGKALRQQYRNLAGAPEMVRLSTLGAWDSRYYPYNEQTAQEEVDHYYQNDLPLDNLIIDTDWRAGFDGKGYFVNEALFPNMPRFLKSMHDQNIDVCFNDHPEPQKGDDGKELPVLDPKEVQFRRYNLAKIIDMGLDTWWYDRNWSTSLICPGGKSEEHENWLNHETWGDYLYNNVTKQTYINRALDKYAQYGIYGYRRPTAMSNVVQVRNGHWERFTDSMAHRYSIQWTGDQQPSMLPTEVVNVVRTGNDCMPYMSSDLAGHTGGVADDYYYQRWMEYGALSPIFRIHCTRDLETHCQPWYRPENVLNTFRDWIKLRYRLLPLYYSLAKESYDTCLPICRALSLEYQDDPNTHGIENQYLIGSNILFAPCTATKTDTIEGDSWGHWDSQLTAQLYPNKNLEGEPKATTTETNFSIFNDMREYFKKHSISETGENSSARITGKFTPTEARILSLRSDDGCRFKIKDAKGNIIDEASDWTDHEANRYLHGNVVLEPGTTYTIEIEYYNAGNEGWLYFAGTKKDERTSEDKEVYLPKGDWYNVFNGQTYSSYSGQKVTVNCPVNENALFVKLGTMLPLIGNAQNTKELDWTNLAYDVYPINKASSFTSSLYEDDFETVAYQNGWYHDSPYNCHYDAATGEYVVQLAPSQGWYIGDDAVANRTYKIRLHKVNGLDFGNITLDGQPVTDPELIAKDVTVPMPFNFDGASRTEDVVEITIPRSSVRIGHEIRVKVVA